MKELKFLFPHIKQPTHVWYADRPPKLGGIPRKITIEELNKKIGNQFSFCENVFVDAKTSIKLDAIPIKKYMLSRVLELLKNVFSDKLVICYMSDEVGYGVFARENIQLGEMLAFYTGELKKTESSRSKKSDSYGMDVDKINGKGNCSIDASDIGGIARFFQHLPLNADELSQALVTIFREDPSKLEGYVKWLTFTDQFTKEEQEQIIRTLKDSITWGNEKIVKQMLLSSGRREVESDWQFKRIKLLNIKTEQIASANLEVDGIIVDNKPIVFFWASRNINGGEQLGFGYWSHLNKLPLLFDKSGMVIPKSKYKYTEMPLAIQTSQGERCFFYDLLRYSKDMSTGSPIKFSFFAQPVSFFWVRNKLAKNNVIDPVHLPASHLSTFAMELQKILPTSFKMKLYEHDPSAKDPLKQGVFDVVCTASVPEEWKKACQMLKRSAINKYCVYHESTLEIIITAVNVNPEEMRKFISSNLNLDQKSDININKLSN